MLQPFVATPYVDAVLMLSDGTYFLGKGIGKKGTTEGEICFNTGITGYQETLTDPSYFGQIVVFTFPHIGNVGTNSEDNESDKIHCRGIVLRNTITTPSNFRSQLSFDHWLSNQKLVGISGVDTRQLTHHIRIHGPQWAIIVYAQAGECLSLEDVHRSIADKKIELTGDLAQYVTASSPYSWPKKSIQAGSGPAYKLVVIDYGVKHTILNLLAEEGFDITVMPSTVSFSDIMALSPDGVFLSNGPGDPSETGKTAVPVIQHLLDNTIPIFGICLGHQLLALAMGLSTEKMHAGHRGANQPVQEIATGNVFITSQNHGFCVSPKHIPSTVQITYRSLFDQSIEGFCVTNKPAFSVQFHPESSPGPHDTRFLFAAFKTMISTAKKVYA